MKLVKPFNGSSPSSRINREVGGNRMLMFGSILTILLGVVLISIAKRSTTNYATMQLQVVGGPWELKPANNGSLSTKSQSSSAAPLVAVGDLVFSGSDVVWMKDYKGVLLLTRDAGESWTPIGGDIPKNFDTFTITDGFHGWAVESENKIWKTDDSGHSWYLISSLPQDPELYYSASQIIFNGEGHGWIVGLFDVWRTQNAGLSWNKVDEFSYMRFKNQVRGMYFLDSRLGWAICEKGLVIHTDDGGDHWRSIVDGLPFNIGTTINVSRFLDENRGWISVSDPSVPLPDNVVLFTKDGGVTWHRQKEIGGQVVIHDISFLNDETGWMVGGSKVGYSGFENGVLFRTEDGGQTWRKMMAAPTSDGINSVRFTSPEEGWLTTDYDVYRTHDGGKTWASVLSYPEAKRRNDEIFGAE